MKNERIDKQRAGLPAEIKTAMASVSAIGGVQQGTQPLARCKGDLPGQKTLSTAGNSADGFLRHSFLPRFMESHNLQEDKGITERVLNSLCTLADYHQVELMDVSDNPYPYNLLLAHWNAQKVLRNIPQSPELLLIEDDGKGMKVATRQTASRTYSLYYIPVLPLYRLLKTREHNTGAKLLISIFSYLYHNARIPYYRDADSYLFYHYEIMEEWLNEEDGSVDDEDLAFNRNALQTASHGGDVIQRIIYHPVHIEEFEQRICNAFPADRFEQACLEVAKKAFTVWQDFPNGHLFCHLNEPEDDEKEDDDDYTGYDNTIHIHEYVHFIADTDTSLYNSIQQNVDAELNEKMYWQEHTLISVYDENFIPDGDTLDYENRLFELLDDLCYLLNELP